MKHTRSAIGPSLKTEAILAKAGIVSQHEETSIIYSQGTPSDTIFYIQKGIVMLSVKSKHHRTAVIAVLGAGSFFNELCMLDHPDHMSTAIAITASSILTIKKKDMARVLCQGNDVSKFFLSCLLRAISRFREDLAD